MTDFVLRIDSVLKKLNLKRASLCSDLGLSSTAITDWARRGTVPAGDICLKIADYLKVSAVWLITGKEEGMSNEEKKLLMIYQKLTAIQKDTIWTLLDKWEREIEVKEEAERMA